MGEHIPNEATWEPNPSNEAVPNDVIDDNGSWATKRDAWAEQMWVTRGIIGCRGVSCLSVIKYPNTSGAVI